MPVYLGIDLGTTNSAAAVFDGERVTVVRNPQGGSLTPSVVRLDAKGAVTVGARARRFLESDPRNTRAEFKRLMGTATAIDFAAAKLSRRPEELAAEILKSLRADVEAQLGFSPARAVVSVPALFELPQSAATSEAARLAGFDKVELIQEPIASALAAGWAAEGPGGKWLVFDLGGGTFDASLLETKDGMLRVVGHDGDNFLGGRDVDSAIVDFVVGELGGRLKRDDPAHAGALRQLKQAAEEAKIELSRAESAGLAIPGLRVGEDEIDVDFSLQRAWLERLTERLVDRAVAICERLCAAHGVSPGSLERVVLVGGPTAMPLVRERVRSRLGPVAERLDPMTLVAEGAALYAASLGLEARAADSTAKAGRRFWVQHPAMSTDTTPHVIGKLLAEGQGPAPARVRLARADGLWASAPADLDAEGTFVVQVELLPRRPNVFALEAHSAEGERVPVLPATITIVQGLTLSDPPLSRSIGVALASDQVHVFFDKGAPLPNKRTVVRHTLEGVARGQKEALLRIPIVQGEYEQAHLCRLVGTLVIPGDRVSAAVPAGSAVEITLELDRGGRLAARALVPSLGQVFEDVAELLVPEATPEVLEASVAALRERLVAVRKAALGRGDRAVVEQFAGADKLLAEAQRDLAAARGGDADAAQKARRTLLELDAMVEEVEADARWPEVDAEARERVVWASRWVSQHGTTHEKAVLDGVTDSVARARKTRDLPELQRQMRLLRDLGTTAFHRHPEAWEWLFESAASEIDGARDLPRARKLVDEGRRALGKKDTEGLRRVTEQLWDLLPVSAQQRRLGYDSGLR